MPRIAIAVVGGLAVFFVYLAAALRLADYAIGLHWALQVVFYAVAGAAWVFPIRWIMLWSVHKRG